MSNIKSNCKQWRRDHTIHYDPSPETNREIKHNLGTENQQSTLMLGNGARTMFSGTATLQEMV